MTKRRKILLACFSVLMLGIVIWACFFPRFDPGPSYNGKTLSEWVLRYSNSMSDTTRNETDFAIRQIGTNALPLLLRWIHNKPPRYQVILFGRLGLRPPPASRNIRLLLHTQDAFAALGTNAQSAIPELVQMLKSSDPEVAYRTTRILGCLKLDAPMVVPALTTNLSHANYAVRIETIEALGAFGTNARSAIPTLLHMAEGGDSLMGKVLGALISIAPEMFDATNRRTRKMSMDANGGLDLNSNALRKIDPESLKRAAQK